MRIVCRQWMFGAAALVGLLWWTATSAQAQVALPSTTPAAPVDNTLRPTLRFDRVTGMTKGAISAIAQDATGMIWFGTEEGLSRYDGYEFVNYVTGGVEQTLSNFTVTSLATDKDSLWVGTVKGLNRLELATGKFTQFKSNPQDATSIAGDFVTTLHYSKAGQLWIGYSEQGLDAYNPATKQIQHYRSSENSPDSLGADTVSAVAEDKDGKIWVGMTGAGVDALDPKTGKFSHHRHDPDDARTLSSDSVTTIYLDRTGTLWVGTDDGLNRYEPGTNSFKRYLKAKDEDAEPTAITTIVEGNDGGLWLGVQNGGVLRFDRVTGVVERYAHDSIDTSSISHQFPRSSLSDAAGVLWFGFNAAGASKLPPMRRDLTYYRTNPGIAFLEEGDKVWLGTLGRGGLRLLDLKTGAVTTYLEPELAAMFTWKILPAEPGSLWIATSGRGLLHFTPNKGGGGALETYDIDSGLLKTNTVNTLESERDVLWIGTDAGVSRYDLAAKNVKHYNTSATDPGTLSSDDIVSLHLDRNKKNVLWVGTKQGLNELDKTSTKVIRHLHDDTKPNSLSHDHVTDIHEDAKGRIWVGTWGGGLNLFDRTTATFSHVRAKDGLASDTVFGILEDKTGALWLTTGDGVSRFDPEKKTFTNYRVGDGLQSDTFAVSGFHQGASGRFYVGGPGGFNVITPEKVKADTYVPPMVITNFEIQGTPRPTPTSVTLGFRDRWFSLSYAALAYAAPARNLYKVRLKNFDDDWDLTDRRFVSFSGLPPGEYTLEILGSSSHGVWNEQGIRIPIFVNPPPWRTWWAYGIYCLLVAVIIALFIRRQRRQLSALQQAHRLSELEREIELTSAVQEGFFPTEPSVRDGAFRLEGFYKAASQCSGDWWWYEARGDEYFIVVGDVTGHGAGSAMVTAAAAACFRSLGSRVDDDERLQEMNDEVLRVSRGQYHMTLTALTLDVGTGEYIIRSAGGVPVFALPPKGRTKVLMCPGMPLGSPEFQIGRLEGRLAPGERVLIMTDGIPEVAMTNAQLLGPRGVSNFYMQTREQELKHALDQLIQKVTAVQAGAQDDDWTAVMLQWGMKSPMPVRTGEEGETTMTGMTGTHSTSLGD